MNDAYSELLSYTGRTHKVCRDILNIGKISFLALPVIMLVMMELTGANRIVVLIIWIILMFILALVLILVGYFDNRLIKTLQQVGNEEGTIRKLSFVDEEMVEAISNKIEEKLSADKMTVENILNEFYNQEEN